MERFNEAFWVDARGGYYALALDGEKRPVDSLSSNVGHLLWSGIVPEERVECIVDALAGDALFSGWGVRTMSADDAGYNPLSYHNGTVWPHDNSLIAAGLARAGRWFEAFRIARRMLEASEFFDYQLPEVFAGLPRSETPFPIAVPDGRAAAGVGRGDARAAAPAAARAAAERRAARARERRAGAAVVGRGRAARGRPRLRPPLGRGYTGGARGDRSGVRVAIVSPVWFPVPPTGYGGIEWVVSLLADGLVDAGHDVALYASGDSRTQAELRAVYETAPSEWIGHTFWELRHFAYALDQRGRVRRPPRPHRPARADPERARANPGGPHGPRPADRRARASSTRRSCRLNPAAKLISLSLNQRKPRPDLPWLANCPNALDFSLYPGTAHRGDYLCFLGRMSVGEGLPPRDRRRPGGRAAAEDRGQEPRAARAAVLRRVRRPAPRRPDRVPRRGQPRREGRAARQRARDALPDPVGGAVRAGDDRVDGVRDARDRHPLGRGRGGHRGRRQRRDRRPLPATCRPPSSGRTHSIPPRSGRPSRSSSRRSGWCGDYLAAYEAAVSVAESV